MAAGPGSRAAHRHGGAAGGLPGRRHRDPSRRARRHPCPGDPSPVGVELGRRGRQADHDDRGPPPQAPPRRGPGRARRHGAGRPRMVDHPCRHRPRHRGDRVRHQGRRPGLRDGVPDPHRGSVLQGRLRGRQRAPRGRGSRRGDRPAPDAPARRSGVVARRLERVHPAVVQPDPAVLGRRRGLPRSSCGRPRSRPDDRGPGRGRDAWGPRVGGHVPRRRPDRHLGHGDRHGWTLHQAPAASLDRRPGSRGERASSTAGRGDGGGVDRDGAVGYALADRDPASGPSQARGSGERGRISPAPHDRWPVHAGRSAVVPTSPRRSPTRGRPGPRRARGSPSRAPRPRRGCPP